MRIEALFAARRTPDQLQGPADHAVRRVSLQRRYYRLPRPPQGAPQRGREVPPPPRRRSADARGREAGRRHHAAAHAARRVPGI
jgi:hypothetical protein